MTLNEIAATIYNGIRGSKDINDDTLGMEQIKYLIYIQRAVLIRRDFERNSPNLSFFSQIINVPVTYSVSTIGARYNVRSSLVEKISPLVRLKNETPIFSIRSEATNKMYRYISSARYDTFSANKYTGAQTVATIKDGVLYVANSGIFVSDVLVVEGIFDDPREAGSYGSSIDKFFDDKSQYPVSADFADYIIQSILSKELKLMATTPIDTIQNHVPDAQYR